MKDSNHQSQKLEQRLLDLSVATIKVLRQDKNFPQSVKSQFIRSITSIGANYMEANNASSPADFRNKIFIAKKETAESIYWLRIVLELTDEPKAYELIRSELDEVIKIFQKIVNTINKNGESNAKD